MTQVQNKVHTLEFVTAASLIRALNNGLLFAGTDTAMPMLTTIKFEFDGTQLQTIATNRYQLVVEVVELKAREQGAPPAEPFQFLLQRADAKSILTAIKADKYGPVELEYDASIGSVRVRTMSMTSTFSADTDHSFPAWRQLMPKQEDRAAVDEIGFTPVYLADLAKVQTVNSSASPKQRKGDTITVQLFGAHKPVLVEYLDGPRVLLMPVNLK